MNISPVSPLAFEAGFFSGFVSYVAQLVAKGHVGTRGKLVMGGLVSGLGLFSCGIRYSAFKQGKGSSLARSEALLHAAELSAAGLWSFTRLGPWAGVSASVLAELLRHLFYSEYREAPLYSPLIAGVAAMVFVPLAYVAPNRVLKPEITRAAGAVGKALRSHFPAGEIRSDRWQDFLQRAQVIQRDSPDPKKGNYVLEAILKFSGQRNSSQAGRAVMAELMRLVERGEIRATHLKMFPDHLNQSEMKLVRFRTWIERRWRGRQYRRFLETAAERHLPTSLKINPSGTVWAGSKRISLPRQEQIEIGWMDHQQDHYAYLSVYSDQPDPQLLTRAQLEEVLSRLGVAITG